MAKTKTSKKRKKKRKVSMVVNGIPLYDHDPTESFRNHKEVKQTLIDCLVDGDREAFVDILSGYVRVHNISEVCRRTKLSRTVVYEAISESGNPSLDTLCKIFTAFDKKSA